MTTNELTDKANIERIVIKNVDTVAILAGSPVFFKGNATSPGLDVVSGPSGIISMFAGIADSEVAVGALGNAIIRGHCRAVRVPAVATGVFGDNFIPTAGSAGIYSCAAGTATALTPRLILLSTLIAGAVENSRAKMQLVRR